jgi:hypothetical protein
MDNVETLIDCIAGAIVAAHGSGGRWKLDLARIAAVGDVLGVLPPEARSPRNPGWVRRFPSRYWPAQSWAPPLARWRASQPLPQVK